jgi:hypothetical protein
LINLFSRFAFRNANVTKIIPPGLPQQHKIICLSYLDRAGNKAFFYIFEFFIYNYKLIGMLSRNPLMTNQWNNARVKHACFFCLLVFVFIPQYGQLRSTDNQIIHSFYREALPDYTAYNQLEYLCTHAFGRLAGSPEADRAVEYMYQEAREANFDTVFLQEVWVPDWSRAKNEQAIMHLGNKREELTICALGSSPSTPAGGTRAGIMEVRSKEELEKYEANSLQGKIIFFNQAMDAALPDPMQAYVKSAWQRVSGPAMAARLGAEAAIVRSLATSIDDYPHTGITRFPDDVPAIPAAAISTLDAEKLSAILQEAPRAELFMNFQCSLGTDEKSHNVIAELKGSVNPEKIILVGAHLDTWDNSPGAHDNGAGCVQAVEVLRLFKELGIQPRNTLRVVLFMDEEYAQSGGREYARLAKINHDEHLVAIETDRGGFTPRGFTIDAPDSIVQRFQRFLPYLEPYGIHIMDKGFGGVDISFLKEMDVPLLGFQPDVQRYFEYHHSANDTFDKVSQRELQMGSATIAALVYLIDKQGL